LLQILATVRPSAERGPVSQVLDHTSLAVITVYLRQLEGERDRGWPAVASLKP
jgi:hypothetical protein